MQYFVEKLLAVTEDPKFNIDDEADSERELICNILANVQLCQKLYMNIYDFCVNLFKEWISSSLPFILKSIIMEMTLDWTF